MQSLWGTCFKIFVLIVGRTIRKKKKCLKRLPKENEECKSKRTSKNAITWKKQKMGKMKKQKKNKKSSSQYKTEKITGFNNENVHEKIKSMEARPP